MVDLSKVAPKDQLVIETKVLLESGEVEAKAVFQWIQKHTLTHTLRYNFTPEEFDDIVQDIVVEVMTYDNPQARMSKVINYVVGKHRQQKHRYNQRHVPIPEEVL